MKPPLLSMQFGGFGLLRELCSDHHCLILEHFHQSKKKVHSQGQSFSFPFFCSNPWQPLIYFLNIGLPILDITYKWNHIICGLLFLDSFI